MKVGVPGVYYSQPEAMAITRKQDERLFQVSRSGIVFYVIAKQGRIARAKISQIMGDQVKVIQRTEIEEIVDLARTLSPNACREVVRLLES
jgi:hypothetical protein